MENGARSWNPQNSNWGHHKFRGRGKSCNSYQQQSLLNSDFWCDVCDKGFSNNHVLQQHKNEHQVCNIDGCKYVAHPNVITKHIQMQHSTGLYNRIRSNNTPEDIDKWINDRKRRYPSKENIEKRQRINEEKNQRGEKLTCASVQRDKLCRSRGAHQFKHMHKSNIRQRSKKKVILKQQPTHIQIDAVNYIDKSNWNGKLPPFAGTKHEFDNEESEDSDSNDYTINNKFDDGEWQEDIVNDRLNVSIQVVPIKNALGLLMKTYGSSEEDDINITTPIVPNLTHIDEKLSISEPSDIVKTHIKSTTPTLNCSNAFELNIDNELPEEFPIARNKHDDSFNLDNSKNCKREFRKAINKDKISNSNSLQSKKYRRPETLLAKLLKNEIRHERNVLLQCVRYIVSNNYFQINESSNKLTHEDVRKCVG